MARVLVIAPHTDDEVLGVGGTMRRHVEQGDEVHVCIAADRATGHEYDQAVITGLRRRAQRAAEIIGCHGVHFLGLNDERIGESLVQAIAGLEQVCVRVKPDRVYVPNRSDNNQDHQDLFRAAMVAVRPHAAWRVSTVLMYETLSSTDQAPALQEKAFVPNCFIDISEQLPVKLRAMEAYDSELRPAPHPRSLEGIEISARRWGMHAAVHACEAFMLLRDIQ